MNRRTSQNPPALGQSQPPVGAEPEGRRYLWISAPKAARRCRGSGTRHSFSNGPRSLAGSRARHPALITRTQRDPTVLGVRVRDHCAAPSPRRKHLLGGRSCACPPPPGRSCACPPPPARTARVHRLFSRISVPRPNCACPPPLLPRISVQLLPPWCAQAPEQPRTAFIAVRKGSPSKARSRASRAATFRPGIAARTGSSGPTGTGAEPAPAHAGRPLRALAADRLQRQDSVSGVSPSRSARRCARCAAPLQWHTAEAVSDAAHPRGHGRERRPVSGAPADARRGSGAGRGEASGGAKRKRRPFQRRRVEAARRAVAVGRARAASVVAEEAAADRRRRRASGRAARAASAPATAWLDAHNVRRVVTAARGLGRQFRYFSRARRRLAQGAGVRFLALGWFDGEDQRIEEAELSAAVNFIDEGLRRGESVLVHCAGACRAPRRSSWRTCARSRAGRAARRGRARRAFAKSGERESGDPSRSSTVVVDPNNCVLPPVVRRALPVGRARSTARCGSCGRSARARSRTGAFGGGSRRWRSAGRSTTCFGRRFRDARKGRASSVARVRRRSEQSVNMPKTPKPPNRPSGRRKRGETRSRRGGKRRADRAGEESTVLSAQSFIVNTRRLGPAREAGPRAGPCRACAAPRRPRPGPSPSSVPRSGARGELPRSRPARPRPPPAAPARRASPRSRARRCSGAAGQRRRVVTFATRLGAAPAPGELPRRAGAHRGRRPIGAPPAASPPRAIKQHHLARRPGRRGVSDVTPVSAS